VILRAPKRICIPAIVVCYLGRSSYTLQEKSEPAAKEATMNIKNKRAYFIPLGLHEFTDISTA
jgi:hypothetical protein